MWILAPSPKDPILKTVLFDLSRYYTLTVECDGKWYGLKASPVAFGSAMTIIEEWVADKEDQPVLIPKVYQAIIEALKDDLPFLDLVPIAEEHYSQSK